MQEVDDIVSQEAYNHAGLVLAEAGAVRLVQEEAVLFLLDVVLHRPPLLVGLEYPFPRVGNRDLLVEMCVFSCNVAMERTPFYGCCSRFNHSRLGFSLYTQRVHYRNGKTLRTQGIPYFTEKP